MLNIWKEYANTVQNEKPLIYSILVNRLPTLTNNIEINVELLSQSQDIEFQKEKEKILNFLKNRLRNNQLIIKTIVSRDKMPEISEAITPSEIYKAMLIKNPVLAKFGMDFGLEIE